MRFLREELLKTAVWAHEEVHTGKRWFSIPQKEGNYLKEDFSAFKHIEDIPADEQVKTADLCKFYDQIRQVVKRLDLPEVVDFEQIVALQEKEIADVLSELKTLGLYEDYVGKQMRDIIFFGDGPEIEIFREFNGKRVQYEPFIRYVHGQTKLLGYAVSTPQPGNSFWLSYFPKQLPIAIPAQAAGDLRYWKSSVKRV